MKQHLHIGDCVLCGHRVLFKGDFYETGEGYAHQFCMEHRHVGR